MFVFGRKTRCPLLWLLYDRTRTNALVVLFITLVTILRFTITPITAVVCLRWFYAVVVLYIRLSKVLLIVTVTASVVVPILGLTPHHSY